MTVNASPSKISYAGDGVSTVFPIPFYILKQEDVFAFLSNASTLAGNDLVLGTDYTVQNAGVASGSQLTLTAPLATGFNLYIDRSNIVIEQQSDYVQNDKFPAQTTENALDRLTMIAQVIKDGLSRALHFPFNEFSLSGEIPSAAARANKVLLFDANGLPIASTEPYLEPSVIVDEAIDAANGIVAGITTPTFQAFVPTVLRDGVDYTSGTSNHVTLPVSVTGDRVISALFFDGTFQSGTQWTLGTDNKTVTFSSVIPLGIGEINVAYFEPGLLGAFIQTGFGAVPRPFQSKMREIVSVMDYGADNTGVAYSDLAFAAALAAGNLVFVPPGSYKVQHSIILPNAKSRLVGAGIGTTTITSTSLTEDIVTCADFIIDLSVSRMILQKTGIIPTAGYGVNFTKSISRATIEDVIVLGCWRGFGLGVTDFAKVIRATAQLNYDDGFYMTNTSINSTCQWTLSDCFASTNGGNGLLIATQASSAPGMTCGEIINFNTFGNTKRGIAALAIVSNPINGLRITGGFMGGDGDDEIILDTHAGEHKIIGTFIELPGASATGPLGTPASHIGNGINILSGNIDVQLDGVRVNGASYNGIATAAQKTTITGAVVSNNALAGISGGVSGIVNTGTGTMVVNGGASYGQPIGVFSNNGALTSVTGMDLSGNTTSPFDATTNKTQMQVIGCLPFGITNP